MSVPRPPTPGFAERDTRFRPLLWRLPLLLMLVIGIGTLRHVDQLLHREYTAEASAQAVQTDALLESFIDQRVTLLSSLRALMVAARSHAEAEERFGILAREIVGEAPDMFAIYLLDSSGVVRRVYRRDESLYGVSGNNHAMYAERARALSSARSTGAPATTGTLRFSNDDRGMVSYVPITERGRVTGFIGGAFAYQRLFNDALAQPLQGHFAYRVLDASGSAIAQSVEYPVRTASIVRRDVVLPGGVRWVLQVAVPPFQPFAARLVSWLAGLAFLGVVIFLVLREEARAQRFARHSAELELLSRDLIDANMRLEERALQIAEANRAKSRFLANVSHELRTPLNAIVGYNSLALDGLYGEPGAPLRVAHERIRAAAEHLLGLVNDVLDLSKIEVGRMEVDAEPTDVGALVDGVVTVMEPIADAKGLRLDVVIVRDVPRIVTDPRHLRQILMNLVSNAIKFTERGSVTVCAKRSDRDRDHVWLSVEDTGIGIAPEDVQRIFEEFEQVRPSGRGDSIQRGTGLGLAISLKLARLLGGDVWVESRLGSGSCFTVELPLTAPAVAMSPPTEDSDPNGVLAIRQRDDTPQEATEHVGDRAAERSSGEHAAFGAGDDAPGDSLDALPRGG